MLFESKEGFADQYNENRLEKFAKELSNNELENLVKE